MGGIVPLILGIYLYLQDAIRCLYIVMRANRATMLGAYRELSNADLVGCCGHKLAPA